MTAADEQYVIWSYEHDGFWGPDRCGYVPRLKEAGRYSKAEAEAIVRDANIAAFHEQALLVIPTEGGWGRRR